MNKLIPIYLLLTIIFYSCTNIHFCFKTYECYHYFGSYKPGDTVSQTVFPATYGSTDRPSITHINASGPSSLKFYTGGSSIEYSGILYNGNEFGNYWIEIRGNYSGCYGDYSHWRISGLMNIEKPTITFYPASKFIEPYGEDSCTVTVRPECKYTIYMTNPDSTLEVTPYKSPFTIYKNHLKLKIKDLRGFKRTSLLIFKIKSDYDGSAISKILYITIK